MTHQFNIFPHKDTASRVGLKKIITKERMEEVRKLIDSKKPTSAAQALRNLNDDLESLERRIKISGRRR
jgi:hypothetical protein